MNRTPDSSDPVQSKPSSRSSRAINLLAGSDQAFFPGLVVAVLSAVKSLTPARSCRVTVLDGGLEAESADFLRQAFENLVAKRPAPADLVFEKVNLDRFDRLPRIYGRSAMTYARMLAPSLIDADDVIWIDSDMIIFRDLSEVPPPADRERFLLAGVQDPNIKSLKEDCPFPFKDGDDPTYINCGLLWMNLRLMHQTGFMTELFEKMIEWKDSLAYWDQTALNAATPGGKFVLPRVLNECLNDRTESEILDLVGETNLHMIMKDKPWMESKAYGTVTRDITFFKVYSLLTGISFGEAHKAIRKRVRKNSCLAWTKSVFYKLTGNRTRHLKWKERIIRGHDLKEWNDEIDRRLASWDARNPSAKAGQTRAIPSSSPSARSTFA